MLDARSSADLASQRPPRPAASLNASQLQWLQDLAALRQNAQSRFADVEWGPGIGQEAVHAHKCILYARAPGPFLRQYVEEVVEFAGDVGLLEAALDYFYTAEREAEAFTILLDGFREDKAHNSGADPECQDAVQKLRRDLMYCWRSKLFSDATLVLECAPEVPVAVHRAVLASRSPYFRTLLLGEYSDASRSSFALPSPPFTPASTTFVLGWMYGGTLDSISRRFDLATGFEIWRCAEFLGAESLRDEVGSDLQSMLSDARAPRIYKFARAPDVNCERLARQAEDFIVQHFDTAWTASPTIGELSYTEQFELVCKVAERVTIGNVVVMAVRVASGRSRLTNAMVASSEHVLAMFDGLEDRFVQILATDFAEVVRTRAFGDLVEGFGFHGDVLERLLALVVRGLTERNAPAIYAVLHGDVLLRENGLMADSRRLVVDALEGVTSYIRRRLSSVQAAGAFHQVPVAALQELASVLATPAQELLDGFPQQRLPDTASRPAPSHLLQGIPSQRPQNVRYRPDRQELPRSDSRKKGLSGTPFTAKVASRSRTNGARGSQGSLAHTRPVLRPSPSIGRGLSASQEDDERSFPELPLKTSITSPPTQASAEPRGPLAPSAVAATGIRTRPPSSASNRFRRSTNTHHPTALQRNVTATTAAGTATRARDDATASSSRKIARSSSAKSNGPLTGDTRLSTGARTRQPVGLSAPSTTVSVSEAPPIERLSRPNGAELLHGIPCVVRVPQAGPSGLRARARYIGEVTGKSGSWVGIEADEANIPAKASALDWNDGSRDGVSYFRLMPAVSPQKKTRDLLEARLSPTHQLGHDLPVSPASDRPASCARTRGLFVRPDVVAFAVH